VFPTAGWQTTNEAKGLIYLTNSVSTSVNDNFILFSDWCRKHRLTAPIRNNSIPPVLTSNQQSNIVSLLRWFINRLNPEMIIMKFDEALRGDQM